MGDLFFAAKEPVSRKLRMQKAVIIQLLMETAQPTPTIEFAIKVFNCRKRICNIIRNCSEPPLFKDEIRVT